MKSKLNTYLAALFIIVHISCTPKEQKNQIILKPR